MAMQQCPNGHLYDDSKNSSCPFCSGNSVNATVPLFDERQSSGNGDMFPPTAQLDGFVPHQEYTPPQPQVAQPAQEFPATTPVGTPFEKTTYIENIVNENGVTEVMGWLVCLDGKNRGADFKIHGEKNTIGRGSENDINLDFDSAISKGVNAIIAYDNRNNKFFLYQSNSLNNMYINGDLLLTPVQLKDYDIIEIGNTKMIFRSLCNDTFVWEKVENTNK